jgi:hypothetical protein
MGPGDKRKLQISHDIEKVDICPAGNSLGVRGILFVEALRLYMWYVVKPQQTYNEVDQTFCESINKAYISLCQFSV